jgi:hypothetical protein
MGPFFGPLHLLFLAESFADESREMLGVTAKLR